MVVGSFTGVLTLSSTGAYAATPGSAIERRVRQDDPLAAEAANALALLRSGAGGNAADWAAYVITRDAIADAVAARVGSDPASMRVAWAAADVAHQTALMAALTQVGVPYRRLASKPGEAFDCSGLTTWAWAQAGVALARSSGQQIRNAHPRTLGTAQAGDIAWYPGHVMLWLGVDHAVVEAPQPGKVVWVDDGPHLKSLKLGDPTA